MPGRATAPRFGEELKNRVVELARGLGLATATEVRSGRRLWGARRRIDVVLKDPGRGRILGVECKFQGGPGSAEEKIPATLKDLEYWPIPGIVVIDGPGFSDNMKGFLMSTGKAIWYDDLEDWLKLYFLL